MTDETCPIRVRRNSGRWGGRSAPCGKPVQRNGMCGIHAAAEERRERNRTEQAARDEESKARRQSAARTVALLSKAGIAAEIHYDQTARKYDGRVIVDGDAIVTLLGLQETVS